MNRTVSNNRLNHLADFLDKLPKKRFDYSTWVGLEWQGKPNFSCGTTACALGWATTMPRFRRAGLHLRGRTPAVPAMRMDPVGAGSLFFGVTYDESRALFVGDPLYGDGYVELLRHLDSHTGSKATAAQVAARIRKFIKVRE